ncbi:MAG: TolC family protein [Gallionellaceae bacterium]|nr:TolC family protein [Gallionellaceae bacterium]
MSLPIKNIVLVSVLFFVCATSVHAKELASLQPCKLITETEVLGLTEVVELALCGNPQTREVWASARYQEAQLGVSQAAYLPTLNGSVGLSRSYSDRSGATSPLDSKSAALTLSYLLYDFGARSASLENSRQLLAAASATQDSTVQAVFLSAVQVFYQVQAAQAAWASSKDAERSASESFKAAALRSSVGSGAPADKLQAQTAYSQASLNRIQAEGALRSAQGALANVIGRDANRPIQLIATGSIDLPADFERDVDSLIVTARARRPDLIAAEAQVNAAQANVDAVRNSDNPTITLGASATNSRSDVLAPGNAYDLSLKLNVPIYSGHTPSYRIHAAEAQVETKRAQRDRIQRQIALDVWNAYQNLQTSSQSLRSTADLVNSAEQSERVASARYQAGVGSFLDVLVAQSALASARQQRVQASYNWNIYRATLAQTMGSLDVKLLSIQNAEKSQP